MLEHGYEIAESPDLLTFLMGIGVVVVMALLSTMAAINRYSTQFIQFNHGHRGTKTDIRYSSQKIVSTILCIVVTGLLLANQLSHFIVRNTPTIKLAAAPI